MRSRIVVVGVLSGLLVTPASSPALAAPATAFSRPPTPAWPSGIEEPLTLASVTQSGVKGDQQSWFAALSGDGMEVAFESFATTLDPLDTDVAGDIYVKDISAGALTLVYTSDSGVKGND
jgi:hypothetical protein